MHWQPTENNNTNAKWFIIEVTKHIGIILYKSIFDDEYQAMPRVETRGSKNKKDSKQKNKTRSVCNLWISRSPTVSLWVILPRYI